MTEDERDAVGARGGRRAPAVLRTPDLHLATDRMRATLRVQHEALHALRATLRSAGFVELLPPMIGPVTDPGIRGSKQTEVRYYGHSYRLMTSAILYKQVALHSFPRIFFVAPNVRMEPLDTAETGRHLAEFVQLDVEVASASLSEVLDLLEELLSRTVEQVARRCPEELALLGRQLSAPRRPFARRAHRDVVAALRAAGRGQEGSAEIRWADEEALSREAGEPFFIRDYPKGSRGFYDREDPERPGVLLDFDLILPEGYGEVASGGERESEYARLVTRMRETGEDPAKYGWYLDAARRGIPPSCGFGLGIERLTRFLVGADAVWDVRPFPKVPGLALP
jgi:asparaginyl-tRNA synthetase